MTDVVGGAEMARAEIDSAPTVANMTDSGYSFFSCFPYLPCIIPISGKWEATPKVHYK
jgi:hypothetical protein